MSETIKYITEKLTAPPFNRSFNFITFDGLEPGLLLQLLSDVFAELEQKHNIDIREESPEQTTIRMIEALKIYRYEIPSDPELLNKFCEGLVVGDRFLIYPILEWLLKNFDELKKRAYLAKYLMKVSIPVEFLQDNEIAKIYAEHISLIETFKEAHKRHELLQSAGMSTSEIKKDISAMQEEKEQINRRISRMKKKLEMFPTSTLMLDMAKKLRLERENEMKIAKQMQEQRFLIQNQEQKLVERRHQLNELRRRATECTSDTLLHRLEEEVKVNQYLASDKQPKEIEATELYVEDLAKVVDQPAMSHAFIDQLNHKLKEVQSEMNKLIEKRMVSLDPLEDKASLFRQQASIAANRKKATANLLAETREKIITKQKDVQELRQKLEQTVEDNQGVSQLDDNFGLIQVPKAEEFQKYITDLRTKNTVYKQKRSVLSNLRVEKGILSRTVDILRNVKKQTKRQLDAAESAQGISGYWDTMSKLENVSNESERLNQRKGATLEEMSELVSRLNKHIFAKRDKLAPLIRELRPLRIKMQEISQLHTEKKAIFDAAVVSFDAQTLRLEQEVRSLRDQSSVIESRYHYLNAALGMLHVQQFRLQEEMRGYLTTSAATGDGTNTGVNQSTSIKRRSYREAYLRKISDQESLMLALREEQKHLIETEASNLRQVKLWQDLLKILEKKLEICQLEEQKLLAGGEYSDVQKIEKDRLLL